MKYNFFPYICGNYRNMILDKQKKKEIRDLILENIHPIMEVGSQMRCKWYKSKIKDSELYLTFHLQLKITPQIKREIFSKRWAWFHPSCSHNDWKEWSFHPYLVGLNPLYYNLKIDGYKWVYLTCDCKITDGDLRDRKLKNLLVD